MNALVNQELLADEDTGDKVNEQTTLDQNDLADLDLDVPGTMSDVIEAAKVVQKRKINQIPHLIDNKRKHLEKTLSAAQQDKLLLNEAREDSTFRKNLVEATRQSTESFSNVLKDVSNSIMQVGNGISRSMEMMSQAIMAQVMANSQP